jgi:hypothetical protein
MKNYINKGVFTEILGREGQPSEMQAFVSEAMHIGEAESYVQALQMQYASLQQELVRAAALEEIILLHRALENQPAPKFSLVGGYIYARTPIFRRDATLKDIRVVVEVLGPQDNYEALTHDASLIKRAKSKLAKRISELLDSKTACYHTIYGPLSLSVA